MLATRSLLPSSSFDFSNDKYHLRRTHSVMPFSGSPHSSCPGFWKWPMLCWSSFCIHCYRGTQFMQVFKSQLKYPYSFIIITGLHWYVPLKHSCEAINAANLCSICQPMIPEGKQDFWRVQTTTQIALVFRAEVHFPA